jgi:hypothetical protein
MFSFYLFFDGYLLYNLILFSILNLSPFRELKFDINFAAVIFRKKMETQK